MAESTSIREPVAVLIKRELKAIVGDEDMMQFNKKFIKKGRDSVIKRLAGLSLKSESMCGAVFSYKAQGFAESERRVRRWMRSRSLFSFLYSAQ